MSKSRRAFHYIVIVAFMAATVGLTIVIVGGEVTASVRLECAFALLFLVFYTRPIFFREDKQPNPTPPPIQWARRESIREPARREVWRVVDQRTGRAGHASIRPALVVETTIADLPDTPERRTNNVTSAR